MTQGKKRVLMKKKKNSVKRSIKRKSKQKMVMKRENHFTEPEYVVQVNEPSILRKELLESLREIIIYMQGYEKFKRIQDEKTKLINQLKNDAKELNDLVEHKLKKHLPKGKLDLVQKENKVIEKPEPEEYLPERLIPQIPIQRPPLKVPVVKAAPSELDELENQLREIENQLKNIE